MPGKGQPGNTRLHYAEHEALARQLAAASFSLDDQGAVVKLMAESPMQHPIRGAKEGILLRARVLRAQRRNLQQKLNRLS